LRVVELRVVELRVERRAEFTRFGPQNASKRLKTPD